MMIRKICTTIVCLLLMRVAVQAQLPFETTPNGHILIKASINGVEGKFIFDTGAGLNAVFTSFSKKIKNEKTPHFFVGHRATGEPIEVDLYPAQRFEIDHHVFAGQQYAIIDMDLGDIDGLISLQAFRNMPVTIDYVQKQLLFNKPVKGEPSIDIQVADYAGKAIDIFTDIRLNDTLTIQTMLDSGAGSSAYWFSAKLMEPLQLNKTGFKAVPVTSDFNKQNNYYIGSIAALRTANGLAQLDKPAVAFVDGLIYEAKTSIAWLGKVLTIDIARRKIFIAP